MTTTPATNRKHASMGRRPDLTGAVPGLLCLLCMLSAACGRTADDAAAFQPRPGSSLLDVLDTVHVAEYPESNLPPAVNAILAQPQPRATLLVPAKKWQREIDHVASMLALVGLEGHGQVWRTTADPLGLDVAGAQLIYGNARLKPRIAGEAPTSPPVWRDRASDTLVFYIPNSQKLVLITPDEPLPLLLEFAEDPTATACRFEPGNRPDPGDSATALAQRTDCRSVSRRALMLPAPGVLEVDVRLEGIDTLSVAAMLTDHRVGTRDQRLTLHGGSSDGATVSVDVVQGGRSKRLWTAPLVPGAAWIEANVDLSAYAHTTVTLRLVTEPGPDGDQSFDYASWADLTFSGPPTQPIARPHVVLIDIDTLRADRLGCYGHTLPTSPRLDAWAAQNATIFRDCTSTSSWTLPATVSMLTGLAVHQHGIQRPRQRLVPELVTLAEELHDVGYETRAIVAGGYISTTFGFDHGFDLFDASRGKAPDWRPLLTWLDERRSDRPAFVFLHTFAVHSPYEADERFVPDDVRTATKLAGQPIHSASVFAPFRHGKLELSAADRIYVNRVYDAGIRRLDDMLGDLLEGLERRFSSEELVVIITSDHGEELFEHGGLSHGTTLYDEMLAIPMLVRSPRSRPGTVMEPVSLLDIVPTVRDAVGLAPIAQLPGRSLLASLPTQTLRLAELNGDHRSVQWGVMKLIETDQEVSGSPLIQLYNLDEDPVEQHDISDSALQDVRDLRSRATGFVTRFPEGTQPAATVVLEAQDRQALEALGYLEGG